MKYLFIAVITLTILNCNAQSLKESKNSLNVHYNYLEKNKIYWYGRGLFALRNNTYILWTTVEEKQLEGFNKLKTYYYKVENEKITLLFTDYTENQMIKWCNKNNYLLILNK